MRRSRPDALIDCTEEEGQGEEEEGGRKKMEMAEERTGNSYVGKGR
jgi:hypothetical protein